MTATTTRTNIDVSVGVTLPSLELAGIAGLASIVAIHATELANKTSEVPYLGAGYVALIAGEVTAIVMLAVRDPRAWKVAAATAVSTNPNRVAAISVLVLAMLALRRGRTTR